MNDVLAGNVTVTELIQRALEARELAYAPYSCYQVGAALCAEDGSIYTGCNVENASYGATNCAERTAIFKAVSEGKQRFAAIAIVGGPKGKKIEGFAWPCGICRQVMSEFAREDFRIIVAENEEQYREFLLGEILPYGFMGELIR